MKRIVVALISAGLLVPAFALAQEQKEPPKKEKKASKKKKSGKKKAEEPKAQ